MSDLEKNWPDMDGGGDEGGDDEGGGEDGGDDTGVGADGVASTEWRRHDTGED